jgi:hypothetical protein
MCILNLMFDDFPYITKLMINASSGIVEMSLEQPCRKLILCCQQPELHLRDEIARKT